MKKNVGKLDMIIRYLLGLIFILLGLTISPWFYILAALSIITALTGFCGLYKLLGINTNKNNH